MNVFPNVLKEPFNPEKEGLEGSSHRLICSSFTML